MLSLIDDILDNARIHKDNIVLFPSKFKLVDLVEEVIEIFEIQAQGKGIMIEYDFEYYELETDRKRLK